MKKTVGSIWNNRQYVRKNTSCFYPDVCQSGYKGEGLYNLLSENKGFRNTVSISKADEVKELFSSFNGDISAGLINVTMNSAPTFIVYADVKNGNALEALYKNKQVLGLKKEKTILELGKNEYVYKSKE